MAITIYGTLEKANIYFDDIGLSDTWDLYTDTQKNRALARATKQVDNLHYAGEKYEYTQARKFPRSLDCYRGQIYLDVDTDGNVITPIPVEEATYIQAKFLLDYADDAAINALNAGITSQSIGSTSESYDKAMLPIDVKSGLCRESLELLKPYLLGGV
ncbi:MAG: DnaT-like ssDNA-binding protein [Pseudomonadota bacterium]